MLAVGGVISSIVISLGNIDRVATVIGNTIGTGDNLRTGIPITHITHSATTGFAVQLSASSVTTVISAAGTSPRHSTLTAAGSLAVGWVISSIVISLGNIDRVATVIGNTIGTGDDLRTGIPITHITHCATTGALYSYQPHR